MILCRSCSYKFPSHIKGNTQTSGTSVLVTRTQHVGRLGRNCLPEYAHLSLLRTTAEVIFVSSFKTLEKISENETLKKTMTYFVYKAVELVPFLKYSLLLEFETSSREMLSPVM